MKDSTPEEILSDSPWGDVYSKLTSDLVERKSGLVGMAGDIVITCKNISEELGLSLVKLDSQGEQNG